jgi:hypothetical protein
VTKVRVPNYTFTHDGLIELGMCPRHALPATKNRKRTYYTATPAWVLLLVLVSLLIAVIVLVVTRKRTNGMVPECARCGKVRTRFRLTLVAGWVTAAVLLPIAASSSSSLLIGVWFAVLVAALLGSFCGGNFRIGGVLSTDQVWLDLRRVHPAFVQAVAARMQPAVSNVAYGPPTY